MSIVHWTMAKAVDYALADLKLKLGKPRGYDDALRNIENKHAEAGRISDIDFALLNQERLRLAARGIVEHMRELSKIGSIENFKSEIDHVASKMANVTVSSLNLIISHMTKMEKYLYNEEIKRENIGHDTLVDLLSSHWRAAIIALERDMKGDVGNEGDSIEIIDDGLLIAHTTNIANAANIVTECFKVQKNANPGDDCANFFEGPHLSSIPARTGCTVYFKWSGVTRDAENTSTSQMEPSILYRQGGWRSVLRPGTSENLTFAFVTFLAPVDAGQAGDVIKIINRQGSAVSVRWE